jgi:hypothetical protein
LTDNDFVAVIGYFSHGEPDFGPPEG